MKEKEQLYLEEGEKFKELLYQKGYSGQKFSQVAMYSVSRIYRFFKGYDDIRGVAVYNAVIFAKILGFDTVDEFYKAIGIDLLKEI